MIPIAAMTMRRLQEPAYVILVILGGLLAFSMAGAGSLDVSLFGVVNVAKQVEGAPESGVLMGTAVLVVLGALITVFTGACEIPRDISSRMIAILLSKPISRQEYVWGKFLGALGIGLTVTVTWITTMLVARVVNVPAGGEVSVCGLFGQYRCLLLLLPITAMAVGISCYMADVSSMIVTSLLVLFGFALGVVPVIVSLMPAIIGKIILFVYLFIPNLGYFLLALKGVFPTLALVGYSASVAFIFVNLGRLYFERGDVL